MNILYETLSKNDIPILKKGGIHIKKANRGKFREYCGGEVTSECIQRGKNSSDPKIRRRATFAANSRKWHHQQGGIIKARDGTKQKWFTRATIGASMNSDPAIMQASGWTIDNDGNYVQQDSQGSRELAKALSAISLSSPTHPFNAGFEGALAGIQTLRMSPTVARAIKTLPIGDKARKAIDSRFLANWLKNTELQIPQVTTKPLIQDYRADIAPDLSIEKERQDIIKAWKEKLSAIPINILW